MSACGEGENHQLSLIIISVQLGYSKESKKPRFGKERNSKAGKPDSAKDVNKICSKKQRNVKCYSFFPGQQSMLGNTCGMSRGNFLQLCAGCLSGWEAPLSQASAWHLQNSVPGQTDVYGIKATEFLLEILQRDIQHTVFSTWHTLKVCPANYNKWCMRLAWIWNDGESPVCPKGMVPLWTPHTYLPVSHSVSKRNLMANSIASFSSHLSCHRHSSIIPFVPWWNHETQIFMP